MSKVKLPKVLLLVLSLLFSTASPQLLKSIADTLKDFSSTVEQSPEVDLYNPISQFANVLTQTSDTFIGVVGYNLGLTADVSAGYRFPIRDYNQFILYNPYGRLTIGSQQYLTLYGGFIRLNIFSEIDLADAVPLNVQFYQDVLDYKDYCINLGWYIDTLFWRIFVQIDINECIYGLFAGLFQNNAGTGLFGVKTFPECVWQTNFINYPLVNFTAPFGQFKGNYLKQANCP